MSYASVNYELLLKDSVNWPIVAAAPGFFVVDMRCPDGKPEAVLAWRVGTELVLPVTRHGSPIEVTCVVHPDSTVRFHGHSTYSAVPDYESIEAFRADNVDEEDRVIGSPSGQGRSTEDTLRTYVNWYFESKRSFPSSVRDVANFLDDERNNGQFADNSAVQWVYGQIGNLEVERMINGIKFDAEVEMPF
jgi:hypothetical protein